MYDLILFALLSGGLAAALALAYMFFPWRNSLYIRPLEAGNACFHT